MSSTDVQPNADSMRDKVREGYREIAEGGGSCCCSSPRAGQADPEQLARAFGYTVEELAEIPDGANMGLSCGNPSAIAALQSGEVVLDLGAGGGFDAFICSRKVGETGRVIGVDMTSEMISKARGAAAVHRERSGLDNVEFRLGEIEHLPVADASVDVVISNCVINLSPDKPQVWSEIARVLRPGGRVALSDLALLKPLPQAVRDMVEALVGCVAGAVLVEETVRMLREAGLDEIVLTAKPSHLDSMTDENDPLCAKILAALPEGAKMSDFVVSLSIAARRPKGCCGQG
jgi:arsenite methyltransferase